MKVTLATFLVIQLTLSIHEYTNLEIFNAEVDKEFRDFLKGRNLNDKQQRERYLKDISKDKQNDKKKQDRKLNTNGKQLQDLVEQLLKETDPSTYQPPVQTPLEQQLKVQKKKQIVQQLTAEQQQHAVIKKVQSKQPMVVSSSAKKDDILDLFEQLLGKGNWANNKEKLPKRNIIEPEDDSEDPEHNHHWQIQNQDNKEDGDISIDHSLFKINSNDKNQRPIHMIKNQQIFNNADHSDPFGLNNAQKLIEEDLSEQQLQKMVEKLSYYENLLKQENDASSKTKKSILVLLQQISNKFHLPQKFQDDIKQLFEQDGVEISDEQDQNEDQQEEQKMNEILKLIGFNNLATLENNSLHNDGLDQQNLNQGPVNIKNDVDQILQQFINEQQQHKKQQFNQMNDNKLQGNPLLALQELFDDFQNVSNQNQQKQFEGQPQMDPQTHNMPLNLVTQNPKVNQYNIVQEQSPIEQVLQNQFVQAPQLDEPVTITQDNQNQNMLQSDHDINNQPFQKAFLDQDAPVAYKDEHGNVIQDNQNSNILQNNQDINNQPFKKVFLDQDAPVAYKDEHGNVTEYNNPLTDEQMNQHLQNQQIHTNVNEQKNEINNQEQVHHFTITLNDEEKGNQKVYKINCVKGNCENEDVDSPLQVQLHSPHMRLI